MVADAFTVRVPTGTPVNVYVPLGAVVVEITGVTELTFTVAPPNPVLPACASAIVPAMEPVAGVGVGVAVGVAVAVGVEVRVGVRVRVGVGPVGVRVGVGTVAVRVRVGVAVGPVGVRVGVGTVGVRVGVAVGVRVGVGVGPVGVRVAVGVRVGPVGVRVGVRVGVLVAAAGATPLWLAPKAAVTVPSARVEPSGGSVVLVRSVPAAPMASPASGLPSAGSLSPPVTMVAPAALTRNPAAKTTPARILMVLTPSAKRTARIARPLSHRFVGLSPRKSQPQVVAG